MFHDFEEVLAMSRPSPETGSPKAGRRRLPTRAKLAVALAAAMLPIGAVPLLQSTVPEAAPSLGLASADAATTCVSPPLRGAQPAAVPTCPPPSSASIPPTSATTPDQATWFSIVSLLDQDPGGLVGPVTADRSYLSGATATPAGSSNLLFDLGLTYDRGDLTFTGNPQPAGTQMAVRIHESASTGSLCRLTQPVGVVPSGPQTPIIAGAPTAVPKASLDLLMSTAKGAVTTVPPGWIMHIASTNIESIDAAGMHVTVTGDLSTPNINTSPQSVYAFNFTYHIVVALSPNNGPVLANVLTASVPNAGTLELQWQQPPTDPQAEFIRRIIQIIAEPTMRPIVPTRIEPVLNSVVLAEHDVRFFTEQGFSLSMRAVTFNPGGAALSTSFCRLGTT
jgi:hypothetical protein